jgi:hypothetical protein
MVPHPCSSCFIRPRSGIANSPAIVAASPGVITPPARPEVTGFIAAAMTTTLSTGGKANFAERSR